MHKRYTWQMGVHHTIGNEQQNMHMDNLDSGIVDHALTVISLGQKYTIATATAIINARTATTDIIVSTKRRRVQAQRVFEVAWPRTGVILLLWV